MAKLVWLALLSVTALLAAQPDVAALQIVIQQFREACEAEKTSLWGVPLWGRVILVDPDSRNAFLTERDPEGKFQQDDLLFRGTLPADIMPANTYVRWGEKEWAMILLPLPQDPFLRVRLLAHESFHRVQGELNLRGTDSINSHLDSESGRLWLRLELRALARALRSEGNTARQATNDAILFRAFRQSLHQGPAAREAALEIQEGLAEYTGTVVALQATGESTDRVARSVESFEDRATYGRSFAYATGPALGLLLDRYAGTWRKKVRRDSNLAAMLAAAVHHRNPADLEDQARRRGELYGYRNVAAHEREREVRHQQQQASFGTRFLEGPTLRFPKVPDLQRGFNPNNLVSLGEHGTVYPTGTFTAPWGKLQIDDVGGLLSPDNLSLRVVAPKELGSGPLAGPGWKLDLAPGWMVKPAARAGDFEVVRQNP